MSESCNPTRVESGLHSKARGKQMKGLVHKDVGGYYSLHAREKRLKLRSLVNENEYFSVLMRWNYCCMMHQNLKLLKLESETHQV